VHSGGAPACATPAHVAARALCPALRNFAATAGRVLGRRLGTALAVVNHEDDDAMSSTLVVDEVKAQYQDGSRSCFPCHFDTTTASGRVVTAILYLNRAWCPADGGELRILPAGARPVDVAPLFNRLVLFSSTATLHRTLPSSAPRRCVSFWFKATTTTRRPVRVAPAALCARCFSSHGAALTPEDRRYFAEELTDDSRRALAKLGHRTEYAASFRDAFDASEPLRRALDLDAATTEAAIAALAPPARRILDAFDGGARCVCGWPD